MSTEWTIEKLTPVIQAYSVLAVALAAGTNLSTTIVSIPALLHAESSTLARQWKILFESGTVPVVSLTMSSAAGFAALAYRTTLTPVLTPTGIVSHAKRNLYIGAAMAAFGLAPYTRILMYGTIGELEKRAAAAAGKEGKADTHLLVKKWSSYNFVRGTMLLVSAGLGMWACVS